MWRRKKRLILSICIGMSGLLLSWFYLAAKERSILQRGEVVAVLVAKEDISTGVQLNEWLVERKFLPREYRQPEALGLTGDIVGLVAAAPILKGEQIISTKLAVAGVAGGLVGKVPIGMRAVSLPVDSAAGISGLIKPGNFVDLLATFDLNADGGVRKYTYTILQNVPVLSVGKDAGEAAPPEKQKTAGLEAMTPFARTRDDAAVTVALKPDEVQKVIFAREAGRIALSLRNPLDDGRTANLDPATAYSVTRLDLLLPKKGNEFREYRGR